MKKFNCLLVILSLVFGLTGCSTPDANTPATAAANEASSTLNTAPSETDVMNQELAKIQNELNNVSASLTRAEAQLAASPKTAETKLGKKRSGLENEVKHYQFIKTNLELKKGQIESKLKVLQQSDLQPK